MLHRPQRTLKKPVSFSGVGIHTGKEVTLRFVPTPPHSGIVFKRVDLPGKPVIPAAVEYVQETSRSTSIGIGNCTVQTVEHVMAALWAYQIDNLCVEVSEGEPPVSDGSSLTFVEMIEEAGIEEQQATKTPFCLERPVYYSAGQTHLVALPCSTFRISYTLHYPQVSKIRSQYLSIEITPENFKNQLASCRTFALYEEITLLMEHGLIRGGSLENAVVIQDDVVFSKGGLRFPDEMVRHKILDLVGDLALVGIPFQAHVIAVRSGHAANVALAKEMVQEFSSAELPHTSGEKVGSR